MSNASGITKKKTIEYARAVFNRAGYTLIDQEYVNVSHKMTSICPSGHTYVVALCNFDKRGFRCPICSGNKKRTLDEARTVFLEKGFTPLFSEYKKNTSPVLVRCPNQHEWSVNLNNFMRGARCPGCTGRITKHTHKSAEEKCKQHGFELKNVTHSDGKAIATVKCKHGHVTKKGLGDVAHYGCLICCGRQKFTEEKGREELARHGYALIEWNGHQKDSIVICPKGHEVSLNFNSFKNHNARCIKCSPVSKPEEELSEWISSMGMTSSKKRFKKDLSGSFEIDIYIPDKQIGLEFNGLYWHSEKFKEKNFHLEKTNMAQKQGIRVIHIFEDEWLNRKMQVKGYLKSVIGLNSRKIPGRKTQVVSLDQDTCSAFLNENHIQGKYYGHIRLGLIFEGELVGVMLGSSHHRKADKSAIVLSRMCFKYDTTIQGGAGKLFSEFKRIALVLGYKEVISWSDNRWSEGNIYQTLGFQKDATLRPDYSYIYGGRRLSKQSCTKKMLLKKGAIGNTEADMARSLGYLKIYDCGKIRWKMEI